MPNTLGKNLNLNLCFKNIKLSQLFSQSPPMTTPQTTPEDHSRPLPQPNCTTSILVRNFNSLYDDALDSTSKSLTNSPSSLSAASVQDDDGGAVAVAAGAAFASRRFFFSTPGRSNSIVDSSAASTSTTAATVVSAEPDEEASAKLFGNSVAVPTISPDPYADFRRSMQEMVEAREVAMDVDKSNWEFLHELLLCYLALNPKSTHKFIIGAFADLVVNVLPSPPETGGRREPDVVADMYENKR
ncbi:transcription repressor OFP16-like [Humulus lupulus]|uniref:transcription repressor OFP16-like n=1 Tax=Humulus lupulus TaxID=3486 RepID=UPI002B408E7B|nr:transcription repressor OFP16-like [Humulus lupulus]